MPGGWDIVCIVAPGFALKECGCAAIHVSLGGVSPSKQILLSDGYPGSGRCEGKAGGRLADDCLGPDHAALACINDP